MKIHWRKNKRKDQKSVQALEKLKAFHEQGKQRGHDELEQVEKEICQQFHISHSSWKTSISSLGLHQVLEVYHKE